MLWAVKHLIKLDHLLLWVIFRGPCGGAGVLWAVKPVYNKTKEGRRTSAHFSLYHEVDYWSSQLGEVVNSRSERRLWPSEDDELQAERAAESRGQRTSWPLASSPGIRLAWWSLVPASTSRPWGLGVRGPYSYV